MFAATRWSNIFFPASFGLFGDFVGGPLREQFGKGVWDIEVSHSRWWRTWTPMAHVSYWTQDNESSSLQYLRQVLDLNGEDLGIPREETTLDAAGNERW